MYKPLKSLYHLIDKLLLSYAPHKLLKLYRNSALSIAHKYYPDRLLIKDVDELMAISESSKWEPPRLPQWVYDELQEIQELDPNLHPSGEMVKSSQFYSAPWTYDAPGELYFSLLSEFQKSPDIIFIVPWIKKGGADLGAIHIANTMAQAFNANVAIITTEDAESPWSTRLDRRVSFIEAGGRLKKLNKNHQIDVIARLTLQTSPRAVHIMNSELGWEMIKRNGLAIKQYSHIYASLYCDDITDFGQKVGYARKYLTSCYPHLTGVICDNSTMPRIWSESMGIDPKLFYTIKFPAPNATQKSLTNIQHAHPKTAILWAGRLDRQKRPDLLAEIAKHLPHIQFDVYGSNVLDKNPTTDLSSISNIKVKGAYNNFSEIANSNNYLAYLYTSEWDGLPNVLLEACASGLPIISSNVGGIQELLSTEQCVTPFDNVDDFVSKIKFLEQNPKIRESWIEMQYHQIKQHHSQHAFEEALRRLPGYTKSSNSTINTLQTNKKPTEHTNSQILQ